MIPLAIISGQDGGATSSAPSLQDPLPARSEVATTGPWTYDLNSFASHAVPATWSVVTNPGSIASFPDPSTGLLRVAQISSAQAAVDIVVQVADAGGVAQATMSFTVTAVVTGESVTTVEASPSWAGVVVDSNNVAGDYVKVTAAFNEAIQRASQNAAGSSTGRGVVELVQGRTYVVHTASPNAANVVAQLAAINVNVSNVEVRTQGLPAIGSGNQAKVQFRAWAPQTGVRLRAIFIIRANNIRLRNIDIDGNKLSAGSNYDNRYFWLQDGHGMNFTTPTTVGGNGGIMNVTVYGATDFYMENCRVHDAIVDGMYLIPHEAAISAMQVTNCDFAYNRRQGMSVYNCGISGGGKDQVTFTGCTFTETGDQPDMIGEAPGAGVDIEPISTSSFGTRSRGLSFYNCSFTNNHSGSMEKGLGTVAAPKGGGVGRGLAAQFSGGPIEDLTAHDCTVTGNRHEAMKFNSRQHNSWIRFDIRRCVISGNGTNAIIFDSTTNAADVNPTVVDSILVDNTTPSIQFRTSLAPTGHSVDVWLNGRNPNTVSTLGKTTITIHPTGLP